MKELIAEYGQIVAIAALAMGLIAGFQQLLEFVSAMPI